MIRHVATMGLLVASAGCKEPEAPPTAAAQPSVSAEPVLQTEEPTDPPPETPNGDDSGEAKSGLAALTNEIVDDARKSAADPALLLPPDARLLMVLKPRPLLAFEPAADLWSLIEKKNDEIADPMTTFRSCVGDLDTIERITIGSDLDDRVFIAMEAPGVGTRQAWHCFQDKTLAKGQTWDTQFTHVLAGKGPQLRTADGDPGYFVNDDTVVLVPKAWAEAFEQRLNNDSAATTQGPLATMLSRVDAEDPLRILGSFDAETSGDLKDSLGAALTDFAVGVRPTDGELRMELSFQADSPTQAAEFKEGLTEKLQEFKGFLPMIGVSPSLLAKLSFGTEGSLTTMDLRITADEFGKVVEQLRSSI